MDIIRVALQTILAFSGLFIYARILGKQQIGQLTFFEYVAGITMGSITAILATDVRDGRSLMHFVSLTVFALLTFFIDYLAMESRPARKLISGEPTVVVHNGKILEENMKKMRYNIDELLMQLRGKNIFNMQDVEYALLEPNGSLSVLPKSQKRPLTPQDMGIPTSYEGIVTELVMDGRIVFQNLIQLNLDEKWLLEQLQQRGISDLQQVALATLDTAGKLYLDVRQDNLTSPLDISDEPKFPVPPPKP